MAVQDYFSELTLKRPTKSDNSFSKNASKTYVTITTFQGYIDMLNSTDLIILDQKNQASNYLLICEYDEDIREGDHIIDSDSVTYNVKGNPDNACNRDHHQEIYLERLSVETK